MDPSLNFVYPSLFNISTLTPDVVHTLPPVLNLSSEKLDRRSLFLLDNMLTLTIYVPKQVAPQALHEVFGVDQFALLEAGPTRLPVLNTELNHNLRNLVSFSVYTYGVCCVNGCDLRPQTVHNALGVASSRYSNPDHPALGTELNLVCVLRGIVWAWGAPRLARRA